MGGEPRHPPLHPRVLVGGDRKHERPRGGAARGGNRGGRVEPVRLARREDQQRVPPLPLHDVVGRNHGFFFLGHHAAGHEHGPAFLPANLSFQPRAELALSRGLAIVFQVSRHFDAVFGRAHLAQPRGVLRRLREKEFRVLQRSLEKLAHQELPPLEPGERFFRDARVREDHGNALAPGFAQEIRPDFRFHHDHQRRVDGSQRAANRHEPIEREIENAVHGLQSFARQALARLGGGRDKNRAPRKAPLQAFGKRLCSEHFANRHGVNPDRAGPGTIGRARNYFRRHAAETLVLAASANSCWR